MKQLTVLSHNAFWFQGVPFATDIPPEPDLEIVKRLCEIYRRTDPDAVCLQEIHSATNTILVAYFTSDILDIYEADTENASAWKINGQPPTSIYRYVNKADACDHYVYFETEERIEGIDSSHFELIENTYQKRGAACSGLLNFLYRPFIVISFSQRSM